MCTSRHTGRWWRVGWPLAACSAMLAMQCTAAPLRFVMQAFPPLADNGGGRISGAFPDLIAATCAALQRDCKLQIYPWRRALRMAEQGEADGIAVIQALPERSAAFYLSPPLIQSSYALLTEADHLPIPRGGADLAGYTLAAYGPSATSRAMLQLAAQAPGTHAVIDIDNLAVLRKLAAGRYAAPAAAVVNLDVARHLIRLHALDGVRIAADLGQVVYCIGLSRQSVDRAEAERFFQVLDRFLHDGTARAIAERHGLLAYTPARTSLAYHPTTTLRRQP